MLKPKSYEELQLKTVGVSKSQPRNEWLAELKKYKLYVEQYSETRLNSSENKEEKLAEIVSNWKETLRSIRFCWYNDITKFYDRYRQFEEIRDAKCQTCTVCGERTRSYGKKFKDCAKFLDLLEVTQDEVEDYKDLMEHENDEIGRLAQKVYHIEKLDDNYYHFLDLDEEEYYKLSTDIKEMSKFSLVKDGKMTKLPTCSGCASKLENRSKWAVSHSDEKLDPNLGPPLPDFAFKLRDFGRIPDGLPKLNAIDRTAIAPFTPFTRILQLRNSSGVEGGAQSATTGTSLSRESHEVCGKEIYIPLTDEECSNSSETSLPRSDMSSVHRIYFMGNNRNWRSMEARLNAQNIGLSFNAKNCLIWLEVLRRTQAFSEKFKLRRQDAINIEKKVNGGLTEITDIHSRSGIIVEESLLAEQMAKMGEDDVSRARQVLNDQGRISQAPGITSCLYTNDSTSQGKVTTLKECGKRDLHNVDNLILTLNGELPNEFMDFPRITALTFPDKFPLYVDEHTFMGSGTMDLRVRRHLLNYYDGRFSDMDFVFWTYNVLRRHETIKRSSTFFKFKQATKARAKFEELCNQENLTEKLERAIENDESAEAKSLNKEFVDLITAIGGSVPWTTLERQRTLGRLYAMTSFLGLPSFFITIAPNIADNVISLELLNHTKCVYKLKESTRAERCRWTAKNPVASAKAFHILVDALVSTFLNIATGVTKRTRPTDCLQNMSEEETISDSFKRHLRGEMGCLGVSNGFYGIFEPQNRGALHVHALLWTLINSELISRCSEDELRKVCVIIDQVIASWINDDDIEAEEQDKISKSLPRCGLRQVADNLSWDELASHAKRIMYRCQLHDRCSFTCFKGRSHAQTCRMALPTGYNDLLRFLQLRERADASGNMIIPKQDADIDPPSIDMPILPKEQSNYL